MLGQWTFHITGHCEAVPHLRPQEALETWGLRVVMHMCPEA